MGLEVKNLPASAGDIRESDSIPGSGRSLGGGHSNPFKYSCLENPMDREAWWATVQGVTVRHVGGDIGHSACESLEANEFGFTYL